MVGSLVIVGPTEKEISYTDTVFNNPGERRYNQAFFKARKTSSATSVCGRAGGER